MPFHYLFTHRQPYPGTAKLNPMKALEEHEDAFLELRHDTHTVIAHRKHPLIALFLGGHTDLRCGLAAKLDSVIDQILKYLRHLCAVSDNARQRIVRHYRLAGFDHAAQSSQRPLEHELQISKREGLPLGTYPRDYRRGLYALL